MSPLLAKTGLAASSEVILQQKLLTPLQEKEDRRSRFSRASLPASERRVRILENAPQTDAKGNAFLPFAIDERQIWSKAAQESWTKDAITGCVYPEAGKIFVKRKEVYYSYEMLLGLKTAATPAEVCRARQ
ncbi:MAG TPA: hypothetical protein DF383_06195 [Deltaproteobacteria bacterium]|nr:hypothetical protein [Deltaproteobacteria bacterium]